MIKYGTNSPQATLRLVIMACFVERKLSAARLSYLHELATKLDLTPAHVSRIVEEHEREVLAEQDKNDGFFFGNGALPKVVVHAALDEVGHLDLQLHVAMQMMQVIMQEPKHTAREVAFVESVIGYWRIKPAWREVLKAIEHPAPRRRRPRGTVR